jgi:hypothetical protein
VGRCETAAMGWMIGVAANLAIGVVAYALAWQIARNLFRDRQWPTNRLALAMLAIVGTCSTGHIEHGIHLLTSPAAQAIWPKEAVLLDVITAAGISTYFYFQTGRLSQFARGAAMFEDVSVRTQNARQIQDDVVQRLAVARFAIQRGALLEARRMVDLSIASTREVVSDLLPPEDEPTPGAVRRRSAASIGPGSN